MALPSRSVIAGSRAGRLFDPKILEHECGITRIERALTTQTPHRRMMPPIAGHFLPDNLVLRAAIGTFKKPDLHAPPLSDNGSTPRPADNMAPSLGRQGG